MDPSSSVEHMGMGTRDLNLSTRDPSASARDLSLSIEDSGMAFVDLNPSIAFVDASPSAKDSDTGTSIRVPNSASVDSRLSAKHGHGQYDLGLNLNGPKHGHRGLGN